MEQESGAGLLKLTSYILVMGIALSGSLYSCTSGDDETYFIPRGYSGRVLVFFDRPEGQPVKYLNRRRLYEIPPNGVLRTKFGPNRGLTNPDEFFYYDNSGGRTRIPYVDYKDARQDQVQVCCIGTGTAGVAENKPNVEFAEFYIGTKAEIEAAMADGVKNPPGIIFNRDAR